MWRQRCAHEVLCWGAWIRVYVYGVCRRWLEEDRQRVDGCGCREIVRERGVEGLNVMEDGG